MILVGIFPLLPIIVDPLLKFSLPPWVLSFLAVVSWVYMAHLMRSLSKEYQDELTEQNRHITENEKLQKQVSELSQNGVEGSANLGLVRKIVEKDFTDKNALLESKISELEEQLSEKDLINSKLESEYKNLNDKFTTTHDQLTKSQAEFNALRNSPISTVNLMELKLKDINHKLAERDEQMNVQETNLRNILDLVPNITIKPLVRLETFPH